MHSYGIDEIPIVAAKSAIHGAKITQNSLMIFHGLTNKSLQTIGGYRSKLGKTWMAKMRHG